MYRNPYSIPAKKRNNAGPMIHKGSKATEHRKAILDSYNMGEKNVFKLGDYVVINDDPTNVYELIYNSFSHDLMLDNESGQTPFDPEFIKGNIRKATKEELLTFFNKE